MTFTPTDDLQRAIKALTVQAVWRASGLAGCPREGNVLVKSPFREDKSKSFSIFARGASCKDQATGDGGIWWFAKLATGKEGKELAEWMIALSGVSRTERQSREQGAGSVEPEAAKPTRRAKPKPYPSAEEKRRLAGERELALRSKVEVRPVPEWSEMVAWRWVDNGRRSTATYTVQAIEALAEARGWPVPWVEEFVAMDLIAWPLLPWHDTSRGRGDERGVAFPVELPIFREDGGVELRRVGYHQRYEIRGEKAWVYVPYLKPPDQCRSEFQKRLRAEALELGASDDGAALVPGLPFVLPGGFGCSRLIITEGQWDAMSFLGACGWLTDGETWPADWWVMGARGNNGADTLLAYWGPWLKRWKPQVLVLADNDKASLGWDNARMGGEAAPWTGAWEPGVIPSFKEKLQALGCPMVEVRRVNAAHGKDFNDYWKAKRPTPAAMAKWLAGVFTK